MAHTFYQGNEKIGICGNRNWHAIFILTMLIVSFYSFKRIISYIILQKKSKYYLTVLSVLLFLPLWIYSIYIIQACSSRGASLAAAVSALLLLGIFLKRKFFRKKRKAEKNVLRKRIFICLFFLFTIFLIGTFAISSKMNLFTEKSFSHKVSLHSNETYKTLENAFNRDVRIPLWIGTLKLIINHPLIGVGAKRFETTFASYRPISYFLKKMSATRSNHPHNTILYIIACYGLPGFVFWAVICLYPILFCFSKFRDLGEFEKYILFAYLCLFIHGCFDLIFFVWPTLLIALIFLGILWGAVWQQKSKENYFQGNKTKGLYRSIFFITGLMLFCMTAYTVYKQTVGSYYIRSGYYFETRTDKNNLALYYYKKGFEYIKPKKFIYKAGLLALNALQNPSLALKIFSYYNFIPTKNYAHNNGFIALSIIKKLNIIIIAAASSKQ
ncbi:MAG: O-antigen ligase family protein [Victivallales bacterium]|nr:O-antigen ligase family protein [Victivallales bacterium]